MIEKPPIVQQAPRPDSRAQPRARTFLAGIACYRNDATSFDCTIRDLSEVGAKLRLASTATLPSHFYLIAVKNGIAYDAHIAWIKGRDVGVSWTGKTSLAEASTFSHLRQLWLAKR